MICVRASLRLRPTLVRSDLVHLGAPTSLVPRRRAPSSLPFPSLSLAPRLKKGSLSAKQTAMALDASGKSPEPLEQNEGRDEVVSKVPAPAQQQAPFPPRALSVVLHASVVALTAATFFNSSLFGYHPTLMALAFLLCMPEGILEAVRGTGKLRQASLYRHLYLQAGASVTGLLGIAAIVVNKNINGRPHLASLHAILGAVAFALSSLVATGGLPLLFGFPSNLKKSSFPKAVRGAHKQFGFAACMLGALVCVLGLQTFKPAHPLHKGALTYILAAGTALSAGLVAAAVLQKKGGRKAKAS